MAMESSFVQSNRSRVSSICSQNTMSTSIGGTCTGSVGVRIGGLWKRSQGLSRFTKANYKHRVFILTDQALSYYAGTVDRVGQMKGRIELSSIRAVEFVEMSAFNLAHTIQVVYSSKKSGFVKLYVTATDKTEAADWVAALRQVCYFNKDMLMHYHPGACLRNKWTCCKQRGRDTLGCQPTYHLLTRSSSRYAQMRRKDTLTNKQQNMRNPSGGSGFSTLDRRSGSLFDGGAVTSDPGTRSAPGLGLSNSCMELAVHPPHRIESFMGQGSPLTRHTNRFSTLDPRVSFLSSEGGAEGSRGSTQSLKRRSRSQVGPETTTPPTVSDFPATAQPAVGGVCEPHTLQTSSGLSDQSHDSDHEPSPPPVPPPRQKRGASGLTQSHSIHLVHRVVPISETRSQEEQPKPRRLKHSNTFMVQRYGRAKGEGGRRIERTLSHSMSALSKPLIEPKVSSTNPNIIHV